MKYGYHFMDWGLWEIDEILEVQDLEEDYITKDLFGEHVFKKEEWAMVKAAKNIFIKPYWDGNCIQYERTNIGPYYKTNIFDTKEAAEEYAHHSSRCFML